MFSERSSCVLRTTLLACLFVSTAAQATEPDLWIKNVDTAGLTHGCPVPTATGSVTVTVENIGTANSEACDVTLFEDRDGDGAFDATLDLLIGVEVLAAISAGGAPVDLAFTGIDTTLRYRGSLLHAWVDSGEGVVEANEGNNIRQSGDHSKHTALPGWNPEGDSADHPVLEWKGGPSHNGYWLAVAHLTDDNGDGRYDDGDVPDVVVDVARGSGNYAVLSGDDGRLLFDVEMPTGMLGLQRDAMAVADVDSDEVPDLVVLGLDKHVHVFSFDTGVPRLAFSSDAPVYAPGSTGYRGGFEFAYLEDVAHPHIIRGAEVFALQGDPPSQLVKLADGGSLSGGLRGDNGYNNTQLSVVADVWGDSRPEIVAGQCVYSMAGGVLDIVALGHPSASDGWSAIANFDADAGPEIVTVIDGSDKRRVHLREIVENSGGVDDLVAVGEWPASGFKIPQVPSWTNRPAGPPTVADLDGDGVPEILVTSTHQVTAIKVAATGAPSEWWTRRSGLYDESGRTVLTAYDLDGDGTREVILRDQFFLYILDGLTGDTRWSTPAPSGTTTEAPVVADVDGDGRVEIVVGVSNSEHSVEAWGMPSGKWAAGGQLHNRHAYSGTGVLSDLSVPRRAQESWSTPPDAPHNTFRCQVPPQAGLLAAPDLTVSVRREFSNCPDASTFVARVGNAGAAGAGPVEVEFWAGSPEGPADPEDETTYRMGILTTAPIAPGDFQDVRFEEPGFEDLAQVTIFVDHGDDVTESDESNNSCGLMFDDACSITSESVTPDVAWTGPLSAEIGDPYPASAVVTSPITTLPIPGLFVRFLDINVGVEVCRGITDASGIASCDFTPVGYQTWTTATFRAETIPSDHYPMGYIVQDLQMLADQSLLLQTTPLVQPAGTGQLQVSAALREDGATSLSGAVVEFTAATLPSADATVMGEEAATSFDDPDVIRGDIDVAASFDGNDTHGAASETVTVHLVAPQLSAEPPVQLAAGGSQVTVSARVLDDGSTRSGRNLLFSVSDGPSAGATGACPDCPVDDDELVAWTYTAATSWTGTNVDTIEIHHDTDGEGDRDAHEPSIQAKVHLYVEKETSLQWVNPPTSGDTLDATTFSVLLLDESDTTAVPLADEPIEFDFEGQICLGSTDAAGIATCHFTPNRVAATLTDAVTASYAGHGELESFDLTMASFDVTLEEVELSNVSVSFPAAGQIMAGAQLREDGALSLSGQTLSFDLLALPSMVEVDSEDGTTNADGIAQATFTNVPDGSYLIVSTWDGDGGWHETATSWNPISVLVVLGNGSSSFSIAPFDPGPPQSVDITDYDDGSVEIEWVPPVNPGLPPVGGAGGGPLGGYLVMLSTGESYPVAGDETSRVITGLTNGLEVTYTVKAVNVLGESAPAPVAPTPEEKETPFSVPSAPESVELTAGPSWVDVTWMSPTDDGGDLSLTYTVTVLPNGPADQPATSPHRVTLAAGSPNSFWVRAHNSEGGGPSAQPTETAGGVPAPIPSAPTDVRVAALPGNDADEGKAVVYWQLSPSNGEEVTAARVVWDGNEMLIGEHQVYAEVTGLPTDGSDVSFQVEVSSESGPSPLSGTSNSITPFTAPEPPTSVDVERAGDGALLVTWADGANNGRDLTGHGVGPAAGKASPSSDSERYVTGLTNGDEVTIQGKSYNLAGPGQAANAAAVTPAREPGMPDAPTDAVDSPGAATITWTWDESANDNGGAGVTGFVVTTYPETSSYEADPGADCTESGGVYDCTRLIEGLTNGQQYVAMVAAINEVGTGQASNYSPAFVPARPPDRPYSAELLVEDVEDLRARWTPPLFNGGSVVTGYVIQLLDGNGDVISGHDEITIEPPAYTYVFQELEGCDEYRLSVRAFNRTRLTAPGEGPARLSLPMKAPKLPDAPVVTADPLPNSDLATVDVTWTLPTGDGLGCPPLDTWLVCPEPRDAPCQELDPDVDATSFEGLVNGRTYEFHVTGLNEVGEGPPGIDDATPCAAPYAPLALTARVTGDKKVPLTWQPPVWDGGCDVLEYLVVEDDGDTLPVSLVLTEPPQVLEHEFMNLTDTKLYTWIVRARNSDGWGADSAAVGMVAATLPDPPTATAPELPVAARPGDEMVTVCWHPGADGGAPILEHEVTLTPQPPGSGAPIIVKVTAPQNCVDIAGLTNDVVYEVEVRARNDAGWGTPAAPIIVTPGLPNLHALRVYPLGDPEGTPSILTGGSVSYGEVELDRVAGPLGVEVPITLIDTDGCGCVELVDNEDEVALVGPGRVTGIFLFRTSPVATDQTVQFHAEYGEDPPGVPAEDTKDLTVGAPLPACAGTPVAHITGVVEGQEIWDYNWGTPEEEAADTGDGHFEVNVDSACFEWWAVTARLAGESRGSSGERVLAHSNDLEYGSLQGENISVRLDPTLLLNGIYEIELHLREVNAGVDKDWYDSVQVIVRGQQKIGNFSVAFNDLTVPVSGVPIQVIRTYDSRDKRLGDFGYGWNLSFSSIRLEKNRPIGADWEFVVHTGPAWQDWPNNCGEETETHRVVATFPDGRTYTFRPIFELRQGGENACQISAVGPGYMRFVPVGATRGTLVDPDSPSGPVNLDQSFIGAYKGAVGGEIYDPSRLVLTVEDGTEYTFEIDTVPTSGPSKLDLTFIEDRNGNTLEIAPGFIEAQPSGKVVTFKREHPVFDVITSIIDQTGVLPEDGNRLQYEYDLNGDLTEFRDREQWVMEGEGETVTPTRYTYRPVLIPGDDPAHHLESILSPADVRATLNCYDDEDRLEKVCDGSAVDCGSATGCIEMSHDLNGRIEQVTSRRGNTTVFKYDGHGNVLERNDPVRLDGTTPLPWEFTYHEDDQLHEEKNPHGEATVHLYDDNGFASSVNNGVDPPTLFTSTPTGELLTVALPLPDSIWESQYDDEGNIEVSWDPLDNPTIFSTDMDGNVDSITDAKGNVTSFHWYQGLKQHETDASGFRTYYCYDEMANLTSQTRCVPHETIAWDCGDSTPEGCDPDEIIQSYSYEYDANGRRTITHAPDGTSTKVVYDEAGRKTESWDQKDVVAGVNTHATWYTYHPDLGYLLAISHPDDSGGRVTESFVELEGVRTESTDRANRTTYYTYDELDRLVVTTHPGPVATTDKVHYDNAGRVEWREDVAGHKTYFLYDGAGRRKTVIQPPGTPESPGDRVIKTFYDGNGRVDYVVNPEKQWTRFVYDEAGRKTDEEYYASTTTPGDEFAAPNATKSFDYDSLGRLIRQIEQVDPDPANDKITGFGHDAHGRLTRVTDALGNDTTYTYDLLGRLSSQTDAELHTTLYEHDPMGRRSAKVLPLGQREEFEYTATGMVKHHWPFGVAPSTDPVAAIKRTYHDATDRLKDILYPDDTFEEFDYTVDGQRETVTQSGGSQGLRVTSYDYYISDGRLEKVNFLTEGTHLEYVPEPTLGKSTVRTPSTGAQVVEHDELGRIATVTDWDDGITTYTYTEAGRLERLTLPNDVNAKYLWEDDPRNLLESVTWYDSTGGAELASFKYTNDLAGHRTRLVERGDTGNCDIDYGYDALHRLKSETYTPPAGSLTPECDSLTISYEYDDVGNRTERTVNGVTTYSAYDDNDQLVSVGDVDYSFDDRGRLNSITPSGGNPTNYTFDDGDRLVAVDGPGVNLAFGYDVDGIRISRTDNLADPVFTTEYLVDSMRPYAQVLEERDADNGTVLVRNLHAGRFLGQDRGGTWSFALHDGLGSVRGLTDDPLTQVPPVLPTVTDGYRYEGFGSALSGGFGSTENSYRFAGEQLDTDLSQYYLRARWMDSRLGSLVSRDPLEGDLRQPLWRQPYQYALSDPLHWRDPSGEGPLLNLVARMLVVGGAVAGFNAIAIWSHGIATGRDQAELERDIKIGWWIGFGGGALAGWAEGFGALVVVETMNVQAMSARSLTIMEGTYTASEVAMARAMMNYGNGRHVVLRKPTGTRSRHGGTSDLVVDGQTWDVYTPGAGTNMNNVIRAIEAKKNQSVGVVVDARATSLTHEAEAQIKARLAGKKSDTPIQVVVVTE